MSAAGTYHVPHDLLEGIWRVESASTFPNPYENSEGYGGDFGTKDIYGPTQEQANLSASILASDIKMAGGSIAGGLSYYSGGGGKIPPKAGYDQVPGETTFGYLGVAGGAPPPPAITGGSTGSAAGNAGATQSVSLVSGVAGDISGSVKEAALRLAEVALALFLGYLGMKALAAALAGGQQVGAAARFTGQTVAAPSGFVGGVASGYAG